jgi:MFS family permease
LPPAPDQKLRLRRHEGDWFLPSLGVLVHQYRQRTIVGVVLMASQAFCYNAIFFTYSLVLTKFYQVPSNSVGWYILPFAFGNLLGPILLGRLFDSLGRRRMIGATYALSGVLLGAAGWAFAAGWLSAAGQTAAWTVIFFFASAAASSAYLTVGETFPLEVRAIAIALFYAFGTAVGGVAGPAVFGALIQSGSRPALLVGYLLGGLLMMVAAAVVYWLGADAERRSLEEVAPPLSSA